MYGLSYIYIYLVKKIQYHYFCPNNENIIMFSEEATV